MQRDHHLDMLNAAEALADYDFEMGDTPKGRTMNTAANALVEHVEPQAPAPVPTSESAAIFQIIERLASNPNADPDKIERFLAMREKELERIAKQAFSAAMVAAQAEMPQVVRDADNDQTRSRYARYETISEAIQPIITRHGFALTFSEGETAKPNHIRTLCDVVHEAGYEKQYYADVPFDNVGMKGNANKTNTHAYASTKSYGKRYLKCEIFDVALKNDDDDGNAAGAEVQEFITEEQVMQLRDLLTARGANEQKFLAFIKVESLEKIYASAFDKAVAVINQHRKSA